MKFPTTNSGVRGPLLIISGPSGTGKSTLVKRLLALDRWPVRLSVSATTRKPRPNEADGRDYFFWTVSQFEAGIAADEFLEHAAVHANYYGTLAREVGPYRNAGWGVILDIDVQGARQVWARCPEHVSIFVRTSTLDAYEERLRNRGTEDESSIRERLENARAELSFARDYPYQILNDDLEQATHRLAQLVGQCFP